MHIAQCGLIIGCKRCLTSQYLKHDATQRIDVRTCIDIQSTCLLGAHVQWCAKHGMLPSKMHGLAWVIDPGKAEVEELSHGFRSSVTRCGISCCLRNAHI